MLHLFNLCLVLGLFSLYVAPPVRNSKKSDEGFAALKDLHYEQYLQEVLKELEGDKAFSEKVKSAIDKNRTNHIANSLAFVHHNIRSRLDELKRLEVERLNALEAELKRKEKESNGEKVPSMAHDIKNLFEMKDHIDHKNPHTFEIKDLKKLIEKTEKDLQLVDKAQEEEYKEHEMKKEYLKKQKLKVAKNANEKKKLEEQFNESEKRHKDHPKVNHPGSEDQLKEIWEKTDKMSKDDFNPKAFFEMHDLNNDGFLDIVEIESLMDNELQKVYEANNSDDDMQERYHEMMRMRQELLSLMDKNKDNLVSKDEFLQYTNTNNFKDNSEWKTEEELPNKPYTDEELNEFEHDYGDNNDGENYEDDEFSDQDETLRYIPAEHGTVKPQKVLKTDSKPKGEEMKRGQS